MDRTNWKFGEFNINIPMLGITYKGLPSFDKFPVFSLKGNGGTQLGKNARRLLERFIRLFGSGMHRLPCGRPRVHRKGMDQDGSTAVAYATTFEYVKISGLSSLLPVKESVHGGLFNDLKVGQRNFP